MKKTKPVNVVTLNSPFVRAARNDRSNHFQNAGNLRFHFSSNSDLFFSRTVTKKNIFQLVIRMTSLEALSFVLLNSLENCLLDSFMLSKYTTG